MEYQPSTGFKINAARNRGLVASEEVYKIGLALEGYFYEENLAEVKLSELKNVLNRYIKLSEIEIKKFLKDLGKICYTDERNLISIPMFDFFEIKEYKDMTVIRFSYNMYF